MTPRVAHLVALIVLSSTLAACAGTPPVTVSTPSASTPISTPSPSAPSNPPPLQVVDLVAMSGGGSGEVELRWTQNPEADVVAYNVLRSSTPGGSATPIATVTREQVDQFDVLPYIDEGVAVGYYRVSAVDSAGQEGPLSAEVCGASPIDHC